MDYIAKNITLLRKAFRLTQIELGDIIGKKKSTVSGYETDEHPPQPFELDLIAKHFGITADQLRDHEFTAEEAQALHDRKNPVKSDKSDKLEGMLTDEGPGGYQYKKNEDAFDVSLAVHTGRIISNILDKHQTPREYYAKEVLKKDSRTLQRICKGEIMAGFEVILQVALYHGEPLELFRTGPLPKGHLLTQLRDKDQIIDTQKQLINTLQKKRA